MNYAPRPTKRSRPSHRKGWISRSSRATIPRPELDQLDDSQIAPAAAEYGVFGRITPQQKERLVQALHGQGRYVAMTGDGVNDVLSLKQADLGIAMQSGSQATR